MKTNTKVEKIASSIAFKFALLGLFTCSAVLFSSGAYAQRDDDRPIGPMAENFSSEMFNQCAAIVDKPSSRTDRYRGNPSSIDENYSGTGWTFGALCRGIFSTGYRALLYGYVEVKQPVLGTSQEENRTNTYRAVLNALLSSRHFAEGLSYIGRREDISKSAKKEIDERIIKNIVVLYSYEKYGVRP